MSKSMQEIVREASFLLPKQPILEKFVPQNPRQMLQHMDFFEADEYVKKAMMYLSPGERIHTLIASDPRIRAHAAVCELCAVFLDRGVAKWAAPKRDKGFLYFFASLEGLGVVPWRSYARAVAKKVLNESLVKDKKGMQKLAEDIIEENLECYGTAFMTTLRSMFFDLPGWTSMFERMEMEASEAPHGVHVRLTDFAAVLAVVQRSSIQEAVYHHGSFDKATPLSQILMMTPVTRTEHRELQNPSGLAFVDQNLSERARLEKQFEQQMLGAIVGRQEALKKSKLDAASTPCARPVEEEQPRRNGAMASSSSEPKLPAEENPRPGPLYAMEGPLPNRPIVQFLTGADERECSFRRHLEGASGFHADQIETFGVAGFFDFPIWYKNFAANEKVPLAPPGLVPVHHLVEEPHESDHALAKIYNFRRQMWSSIEVMWEKASFNPLGCLIPSALSPVTLARLVFMCLCPKTNPVWHQPLCDKVMTKPRTVFKLPMTHVEFAQRLAKTFKNIGLMKRFAPVVVILGHGSRTVNNPFDAAHNCAECGGRKGGAIARLMARAANIKEVREILKTDYGVLIPDETFFVGGYHDTTSDNVELFDADPEDIPSALQQHWKSVLQILTQARGKSAMERSEKFLLSYHEKDNPEDALLYVQSKSMDFGEPRPELGHATNACVVIGPRAITKGCFLARRPFLPSYDPHNDDARGTNLEFVITPALIICSGISLQYLFSTVEGGAGTNAALNIIGEHGVMQGASGDLMLGLPTQMTEMHSPVRSMFVVHAPLARVQAVLRRREDLRNIVHNQWVRFFVYDSDTLVIYEQKSKGEYVPVDAMPDMTPADQPGPNEKKFVPFEEHLKYAVEVRDHESVIFRFTVIASILSCLVPIVLFDSLDSSNQINWQGIGMSICFTLLSLLIFGFSRRYLHGEFMFCRLMLLGVCLLTGFNLVALAPMEELRYALLGWSLMGWSWAFMVGSYSDRPTVKANAMFVFVINQLGDASLLFAVGLATLNEEGEGQSLPAAVGLIIAALLRTSQFPVLGMFQRSSEAPSPCSALSEGALCATIGMVLLATQCRYWYPFMAARVLLAACGSATAVLAGLVAQIRGDRKGSLGHATAATLGVLYVILALGYFNIALLLSFGHSVTRVMQILRSHNLLLERHTMRGHLQDSCELLRPEPTAEWLYHLCWSFNRLNTDVRLPLLFNHLPKTLRRAGATGYLGGDRCTQRLLTAAVLTVAGLPATPVSQWKADHIIKFCEEGGPEALTKAVLLAAVYVFYSSSLVWFVLHKVLNNKTRFLHKSCVAQESDEPSASSSSSSKEPLLKASVGVNSLVGA